MGFWSTFGTILGDVGGSFVGDPNLGGQIVSGITGANAAKSASQLQINAANKSNDLLTNALGQPGGTSGAIGAIQAGQSEAYGNLSPYLNTGANATVGLNNLMDPNSSYYQGFQGQLNLPGAPNLQGFQAPNPQDVLNNPSIKFQLDQGEKAIQNSASAKGILNSGATMKSLNNYAQGVASTGYNNLYNQDYQTWAGNNATSQQNYQNEYQNALQGFNSAAGIYQQTQQNRLGLLNSGLQTGGNAAALSTNSATSANDLIAQLMLSVAGQQGGNLQGAANAGAAGKVGSTNALNGLFNSLGPAVSGGLGALNSWLGNRNQPTMPPPGTPNNQGMFIGPNPV